MDKAIENIMQLLGKRSAFWSQKWFERVQEIKNANKVFRRIASTNDKEQVLDYLAEIRYALIFIGDEFDVVFEPEGSRGPDLEIARNNHQAVVEIMRFRKIYPGPPLLNLDDENFVLPEYGNVQRDTRKAYEKILAKFPQVKGRTGIIAIWNDEGDLDDIETILAVQNIRADGNKGSLAIPDDLLFILYGSEWMYNELVCCFPFRHLEQPFETWKSELEARTISNHIQHALMLNENL